MLRKIRKNKGFTLIELMIVVAIIGILAVLAIFGVRKYLASAKTSEATNTLGAINRMAVAAYERESAPSELVVGLSQNSAHQLCPDTAAIPAAAPANKKYTPDPAADYKLDKGFKCLKFEMTEPQYYAYEYNSGNGAGGGKCKNLVPATTAPAMDWQVCANGNLNGDATISHFTTGGKLINSQPVTVTEVAVDDAEE